LEWAAQFSSLSSWPGLVCARGDRGGEVFEAGEVMWKKADVNDARCAVLMNAEF
jgi:hypothetical protein